MTHEKEKYYTVSELAQQINVHPDTIREWLLKGRLPGFRLNTSSRALWRIRASDWEAFLKSLIYCPSEKTDLDKNRHSPKKGTNHAKR